MGFVKGYCECQNLDGCVRLLPRSVPRYILGRDDWIDLDKEYADVISWIETPHKNSRPDPRKMREYLDLRKVFSAHKLNAEVIVETNNVDEIDLDGRTPSIEQAEIDAGLNPDLLREMVWVDRAEDTPGIIVLPHDDYDRVYVLKGSKESPTVQWVDPGKEGDPRPYYTKPGDGKTYIYVDGFSGGSGTQESPYLIHNIEELQSIKDNPDAHYALANDIDATESKDMNDGDGFYCIWEFKGSLDGRGYSIKNLYTRSPYIPGYGKYDDEGTGGLFYRCQDAVISNLKLIDIDVLGKSMHAAGIVVYSYSSSLSRCFVSGKVELLSPDATTATAGICAISTSSTITECCNAATIIGYSYTGGIVGEAASLDISNSCNVGAVYGEVVYTGGLAGSISGVVQNCFSAGYVSGDSFVGGLLGAFWSGPTAIVSSYWDTETSGQNTSAGGTGKTTEEMMQQDTFENWDFDSTWWIVEDETYPQLWAFGRYEETVVPLRVNGGADREQMPPLSVLPVVDREYLIPVDLQCDIKRERELPLRLEAGLNREIVFPLIVTPMVDREYLVPLYIEGGIGRENQPPSHLNSGIEREIMSPLHIVVGIDREILFPMRFDGGIVRALELPEILEVAINRDILAALHIAPIAIRETLIPLRIMGMAWNVVELPHGAIWTRVDE